MGGGKSMRRRQKNAERANAGNLHKAMLRKRGATATLPLGAAPTKEDYVDRMPASLRKMLALKAAAEQPSAKRRKLEQGQAVPGMTQQQQPAGVHRQQAAAEAPEQGKLLGKRKAADGAEQQDQQQTQEQQRALAPIWQQPKKLKQKKKDYLNAKQKKKRGKAVAQPDDAGDEELQREQLEFGHVVHAPPAAALKSRHWATNSTGGAAKKHKPQKPQKRASKQEDAELVDVRDRAIEEYRNHRPAAREGAATLTTLKALVRAGVGA